ncbi:MAG: amidohydrolase [Candidatus Cyclobacteriaceae bacterium M3_2C_046]
MQNLIVTTIQSDLYWHNIEANLGMFEEKIWSIGETTDLIILPEMFNTGFTMDAESFAEPINSRTFRWMKQQAAQTGSVVMGSYIVRETDQLFNRLIWMEPSGNYDFYDKRHLFSMAKEHHKFSRGNALLIKNLKGWNICPLICYDLRFPVWSRNRYLAEKNELLYDLLIYIANWPESRINAWDILLQARAVENLSYVIGVNRVGKDGKDVKYNGHSAVINPKGRKIFINEDKEVIRTVSLDFEKIQHFRRKFPAHLDADPFSLDGDSAN